MTCITGKTLGAAVAAAACVATGVPSVMGLTLKPLPRSYATRSKGSVDDVVNDGQEDINFLGKKAGSRIVPDPNAPQWKKSTQRKRENGFSSAGRTKNKRSKTKKQTSKQVDAKVHAHRTPVDPLEQTPAASPTQPPKAASKEPKGRDPEIPMPAAGNSIGSADEASGMGGPMALDAHGSPQRTTAGGDFGIVTPSGTSARLPCSPPGSLGLLNGQFTPLRNFLNRPLSESTVKQWDALDLGGSPVAPSVPQTQGSCGTNDLSASPLMDLPTMLLKFGGDEEPLNVAPAGFTPSGENLFTGIGSPAGKKLELEFSGI